MKLKTLTLWLLYALIFMLTIYSAQALITDGLITYYNFTGQFNATVGVTNVSFNAGTPAFQIANIGGNVSVPCTSSSTNNFRINAAAATNALGQTGQATYAYWFNTSDTTFNNAIMSHTTSVGGNGFYARIEASPSPPLTQSWNLPQVNTNFPFTDNPTSNTKFNLFVTRIFVNSSGSSWILNNINGTNATRGIGNVTNNSGAVTFGYMAGANTLVSGCYAGFAIWNRTITDQEIIDDVYNNGTFYDLVSGRTPPPPAPSPGIFIVNVNDTFTGLLTSNFSRIRLFNGTNITEVNTTTGNATFVINPCNCTMNLNVSTTDFFNFTFTNVPLNATYQARIYQSIVYFYVRELGTGNRILANATLRKAGNQTTNSTSLFTDAGDFFTMIFSFPGYFNFSIGQENRTLPLARFAAWGLLGNLTHINKTESTLNISIENFSNSLLLIRVANTTHTINEGISNFTINVTSNDTRFNYTRNIRYDDPCTISCGVGQGAFNGFNLTLINGTFRITIAAPMYNLSRTNFTITLNASANVSVRIILFATNVINVTFFDEVTRLPIGNLTTAPITFEGVSSLQTFNISISGATSTGEVDFLIPAEYTLRYHLENYSRRLYFLNLTDASFNSLNLFDIRGDQASNITITVLDEGRREVERARVKAQRFYITDNSYQTVEMAETDINGKAIFKLQKFVEFYRFIVEFNSTTKLITNPAYVISDDIGLDIILGQTVGQNYVRSGSISHNLFYDNSTDQFTFNYNDAGNTVNRGCMDVYRVTGTTRTLYNTTCGTGVSDTISLAVPQTNGTTFAASSYVFYSDQSTLRYYLATLTETFNQERITSTVAWIMTIITMFSFAAIGFSVGPFWTLLIFPIPLMATSWIGLIPVPFMFSLGIAIACWFAAFNVGRAS